MATATAVASPAPTAPPRLRNLASGLLERQVATANTCGYVSGDPFSSIICPIGFSCLQSTQDTRFSALHCCNLATEDASDCDAPTSCIDSTASCNDACQSNAKITQCGDDDAPFCCTRLYSFTSLTNYLTDFFCSAVQVIQTVEESPSSSLSSSSSGSGNLGGSTNTASPIMKSTGSVPTSTNSISPATSHSTITSGAIAGIVIGSLALITLSIAMILAYLFLTRRNRADDRAELPTAPTQSVHPEHNNHQSSMTMPSNTPLLTSPTKPFSPTDSASNTELDGPNTSASSTFPTAHQTLGDKPELPDTPSRNAHGFSN